MLSCNIICNDRICPKGIHSIIRSIYFSLRIMVVSCKNSENKKRHAKQFLDSFSYYVVRALYLEEENCLSQESFLSWS